MSHLLGMLEGRERAAECARNDAAMLPLYRIKINDGEPLVLPFRDSATAWDRAVDLAGDPWARIEVERADESGKAVPFLVVAAKQAVECAALREITEQDWIAADMARNAKKGQRLAAVNDTAARALDLQHLDAMRRVGAI